MPFKAFKTFGSEHHMKKKAGWHVPRKKRALNAGRELELDITALTNAGDGLGRLDNRVVFVPFTMPGDSVRIKVTQEKKSYVLGQLQEILSPSDDRIQPRCPHAGQCGGCDWQHVPYAQQLAAKEAQLADTLKRIGTLDSIKIEPIIQADQAFAYRNRIQGEIRNGVFHYKRKRSESRVEVARCDIADERINERLAAGFEGLEAGKVELAEIDGQVVINPMNDNRSTELGFRQINNEMSEKLTRLLLDTVTASDNRKVYDLYCGRGDWAKAIAASDSNLFVTGVDSSSENIALANQAAHKAALPNLRFERAKVESVIEKLDLNQSLCIVDPPRAGLASSLLEFLCANPAEQLIYVSCHPATLARDLKALTQSAYEVSLLQPLDMFPQTAHLECFVHLKQATR